MECHLQFLDMTLSKTFDSDHGFFFSILGNDRCGYNLVFLYSLVLLLNMAPVEANFFLVGGFPIHEFPTTCILLLGTCLPHAMQTV